MDVEETHERPPVPTELRMRIILFSTLAFVLLLMEHRTLAPPDATGDEAVPTTADPGGRPRGLLLPGVSPIPLRPNPLSGGSAS